MQEKKIGERELNRDIIHAIQPEEDQLTGVLNKAKGAVLNQLEIVCPTDRSFERIKKEIHYIFDNLYIQLKNRE